MPYANPDSLVSTEWLAQRLDAPDLRIVDGTWYLPSQGKNGRTEYEAQHIPGAVFFDIDEIADTDSDLPHMLPSPEKFSARVRKLGLGDGNRIVVYDQLGMMSAARVWWTFRVFGHDWVAVLDGGFPRWRAEGRPVASGEAAPRPRRFTARLRRRLVRDLVSVRGNLKTRREQVLDARSRGRFTGTEPEPRAGLRSGHIPGSLNLPYEQLYQADGTLLGADALRRQFEAAGLDLGKPIVTSCGSGVTASVLALGLAVLGRADVAVYDGSWTEWGGRADTPVE